MIDISKIKPGDFVTVRARVLEVDERKPEEINIAPSGSIRLNSSLWVLSRTIVSHEPAPEPLKVGDMVTVECATGQYKILALHGDKAWVSLYGNDNLIYLVSQLRRVGP
jgi:hypothetical protein